MDGGGASEARPTTVAEASPLRGQLIRVAIAVSAALAFTAVLLAGVLVLVGRAEWWRGALAATVVSLLASLASVPIIAWALRRAEARPDLSGVAFLVAAAVRAGVSLGAGLLAVRAGGYPKQATLLLIVPYYFALLAAETAVLARRLWTTPSAPAARAEGGAAPAAPTEHYHA